MARQDDSPHELELFELGHHPLSWSHRQPHAPSRVAWWSWFLAAAIVCAAVSGLATWIDDREWDHIEQIATPTAGTVVAIHVKDDIVRPSIVDVALASTPPRTLGVRTSVEDDYHVGQRVTVLLDERHPGRSGFRGDSAGPTWTLGGELLGAVGAAIFALLAIIAAIVRARSRRWYRDINCVIAEKSGRVF